MIGVLPTKLNVAGKDYPIRADYRVALTIFQAFDDPELSAEEQAMVMLECLYEEIPTDLEEACKKAVWFLDGGPTVASEKKTPEKKVFDWEQDEQMIFSALNKVAGREIRSDKFMHLWTFLGLFSEIGESLLSSVIHIRTKKNKGRNLEKHEKEFYRRNKELIDIKPKLTARQKAERDEVNKLLGI